MSLFQCKICGEEWATRIANPTGVGEPVELCKPHFDGKHKHKPIKNY